MQKLKLAILDMNAGHPNQGLRCIVEIAEYYIQDVEFDIFDVRQTNELPDLSYDMYISSGGPGNPLEGNGIWNVKFGELLDGIWNHNADPNKPHKKFLFLICHSFQLASHHFKLGNITKRRATSFGIFPLHKTEDGRAEPILELLGDPFYGVDSRSWQLIQPDLEVFEEHGAKILVIEKMRDHVDYERAIMMVRFSDEIIGTQFHPEADPIGMKSHLLNPKNRKKVIDNFGEMIYYEMLDQLDDPYKIAATHQTILPDFLDNAIAKIQISRHDTRTTKNV